MRWVTFLIIFADSVINQSWPSRESCWITSRFNSKNSSQRKHTPKTTHQKTEKHTSNRIAGGVRIEPLPKGIWVSLGNTAHWESTVKTGSTQSFEKPPPNSMGIWSEVSTLVNNIRHPGSMFELQVSFVCQCWCIHVRLNSFLTWEYIYIAEIWLHIMPPISCTNSVTKNNNRTRFDRRNSGMLTSFVGVDTMFGPPGTKQQSK